VSFVVVCPPVAACFFWFVVFSAGSWWVFLSFLLALGVVVVCLLCGFVSSGCLVWCFVVFSFVLLGSACVGFFSVGLCMGFFVCAVHCMLIFYCWASGVLCCRCWWFILWVWCCCACGWPDCPYCAPGSVLVWSHVFVFVSCLWVVVCFGCPCMRPVTVFGVLCLGVRLAHLFFGVFVVFCDFGPWCLFVVYLMFG